MQYSTESDFLEITHCCHEYCKRNTSDAELDDTADFGADVDLGYKDISTCRKDHTLWTAFQ